MVGDSVWNLFFSTFSIIYDWMTTTNAVIWTDSRGTHSLTFFSVFVSYLLINLFISVIFFFVDHANALDVDDD